MRELVLTTGAIKIAKLQSNRHHQQTDTQLFTSGLPFLPSQQYQSTEGKYRVVELVNYKVFIKLKWSGLKNGTFTCELDLLCACADDMLLPLVCCCYECL